MPNRNTFIYSPLLLYSSQGYMHGLIQVFFGKKILSTHDTIQDNKKMARVRKCTLLKNAGSTELLLMVIPYV